MITKNLAKFVKSLQIKKFRKQQQAFLVEGAKILLELLPTDYKILHCFVTNSFYEEYTHLLDKIPVVVVKEAELIALGTLINNPTCLAVVAMKLENPISLDADEYILGLDGIQDPGNLGTILRTCDWYGIKKIICSEDTVDIYNPKVIAASMGSFIRITITYGNLEECLAAYPKEIIYGAFLEGGNIHQEKFASKGLIIMGNEGQGIRANLHPYINKKIHIPKIGNAESLNVAIATAIILDNLKRNS